MKIAIAGKGGVGKTTIAGLLSRVLAQKGKSVLALDADSNPNLSMTLGVQDEAIQRTPTIPHGLTEWREDDSGEAYVHLLQPVSSFISDFGIAAPDGVKLMVMGEVVEASAGCRCSAHAVARGITGHLLHEADVVVLDMEAGLEHLGRGTAEHVDLLLIVVEPYYRSLMTAQRIQELATQMNLPRIAVVANRVRNQKEREAIEQFCAGHAMNLAAIIPFDESVLDAEMSGQSLLDFSPDGSAVSAVSSLADGLQTLIQN